MDDLSIPRRDFLRDAASALIALHAIPAAGWAAPVQEDSSRVRLLHLALETGAPLAEMKRFYGDRLGLRIREDTPARLTIEAGRTLLTFTPAAGGARPFYHFAFNIPENKITQACEWQQARTPLIPIPARLRDARFPDSVVNYAHWNAHSVFFLDPGGNVVEYIARHDLANGRPGPFEPRDILQASEIAFIVDDVLAVAGTLRDRTALGNYRRGGDGNFMALGDDDGLLLVMKRGRILDFSQTNQEKAASVYRTRATVRGPKGAFGIDGFPYEIELGETAG